VEHILKVFEKRVLNAIFGLSMDGVIGGWTKLYNVEPSIIKMIKRRRKEWAGNVARIRVVRYAHRFWCEIQQERNVMGSPRRRWEGSREIGWGDMKRIALAQDRDHLTALVNLVMILRVP
jgi:hypothetical protein